MAHEGNQLHVRMTAEIIGREAGKQAARAEKGILCHSKCGGGKCAYGNTFKGADTA